MYGRIQTMPNLMFWLRPFRKYLCILFGIAIFAIPARAQFGNSPCQLTNSPVTGYVLTATTGFSCTWQSAGSASVDNNAIKNAWYLTDTGTANAVTGTTSTTYPAAYAAGQAVIFKANATNTGATTIKIGSLATVNLTKDGATALAAGNKVSGTIYIAAYDGTEFQLIGFTLVSADVPGQAFSAITSGTNTAATMTVGTGGSIGPSGSGSIVATTIEGGATNDLVYQAGANTTGFLAPVNGALLNTGSSGIPAETITPTLGVSATSNGTLTFAQSGGIGVFTIKASPAMTTNSLAAPSAVPANGDLLSCTTSSTTCTLTDVPTASGIQTFIGTPSGANLAAALTSPLTAGGGGSGVSNTATHTLGTSNQNWATLGTGIVKNTTTTGALSNAAAADVYGLWSGSCTSSTYLSGSGACSTPSVSSVALSAITASVASNTIANGDNPFLWNSATTTSGRVALTIGETTASTSAGTPYNVQIKTLIGSTATPLNVANSLNGSQTLPALSITPTWNTTGVVDAALLVNPTNTASGTGSLLADFQVGGTSQWKVDKAGNVTQLGSMSVGSSPPAVSGTGIMGLGESTGQACASNADCFFANSSAHQMLLSNNNATAVPVAVTPASTTNNGLACTSGTAGSLLVNCTALPSGTTATTQSANDNSTKVATTAYVNGAGYAASCTTTVTTGTTATLSTCFTVNEEATAATAVTYTLPVAASGAQYCIDNGYNGSAANTGALTLQTSASGQYIVYTDGTLSASGGYVLSSGAARDGACVYGIDSTHWMFLPHSPSGTWAKH